MVSLMGNLVETDFSCFWKQEHSPFLVLRVSKNSHKEFFAASSSEEECEDDDTHSERSTITVMSTTTTINEECSPTRQRAVNAGMLTSQYVIN